MRKYVLVLVLIGGFFSTGCSTVGQKTMDGAINSGKEWWTKEGKAETEKIVKEAATAAASGAEKAANEYTDNKAKEIDKKTDEEKPWTAADWAWAIGLALGGGTGGYPLARRIRLWWTKKEPVVPVVAAK